FACHGALKQQAKLRLDSGASILQGGKNGPAVVASDAAASLLLERVSDARKRMPPEGAPLTDRQIATLRAWMQPGAEDPATDKPEADPRDHWAFRAPVRAAVPAASKWSRNPIDAFLAAEHARHGVAPTPPADKATLLRRVTIDLTGLPPTRDELRVFLAD